MVDVARHHDARDLVAGATVGETFRTLFDTWGTVIPLGEYPGIGIGGHVAGGAFGSLLSGTVLVDNTPPVFKALSMNGRKITGEVVDGVGPIARIEVSLAGTDEWRPIYPSDGIFDEPAETFDANIAALVPQGSHIVSVRAYDSAGNSVSRDIEAR